MPMKDRNSILRKIKKAFKVQPDLARTLHGVRPIVQGQPGKSTSMFPSRKCGGAIALESRLELAYAVSLERNPGVKNFRTQCLMVDLPEGRFAIPDFVVQSSCGVFEVHEIKPSSKDLKPEEQERLDLVKRCIEFEGINYRIIDLTLLPSRREVEKLLTLYSHGHAIKWSGLQLSLSLRLLSEVGVKSTQEAYQILSKNNLPVQLVSYHAFHGNIQLDDFSSNKGDKL